MTSGRPDISPARLALAVVLLLAALTVLSFGVAAVGHHLASPAAAVVFLGLVWAAAKLAGWRIGGGGE